MLRPDSPAAAYDAVMVVSFGGPEGPRDVEPFLDNVLRGRDVPEQRRRQVAAQYERFGGVSPLNGQNRELVAALSRELRSHHVDLPVYWGNRNWHPMLAETIRQMALDGVSRALAFVTSAYGGYSSCRQYQLDIAAARAAAGPSAPAVEKLRPFYDHPGFVEPLADALAAARSRAGPDAPVLFSAHSIPVAVAKTNPYQSHLRTTAALVAARSGDPPPDWQLVYQSRSGPPAIPWLGPDVAEALARIAGERRSRGEHAGSAVVAQIGFTSDHMEVVYDLDSLAAGVARDLGVRMVRAATPGTDPRFVTMIRELIAERSDPAGARRPRRAGGGQREATCGPGCCPAPPGAR